MKQQSIKRPAFFILVCIPFLLNACSTAKKPPSLADIDVINGQAVAPKVFVKPKTEDEIRKAYADYLTNTDVNDRSRVDALSRLAELEFDYSNKLLQEKDNQKQGSPTEVDDKLYDARLDKTIQLLSTSLEDYPRAKNNDTLMYQLAKTYDQRGLHQESVDTLYRLVETYPKSPFYAEAQFRIAEEAFSRQDYSNAEYAYTEAIVSPENAVFYEKSLFKRGWSRFKQQFYTDAVDDFLQAVLEHQFDEFEKLTPSEREQFDEYFRAVGLAFSYLGGSEPLHDYFRDRPDFIYTYHTYSMVSDIYLKQERYTDAVDTLDQFIRYYPKSENIPYSRLKIIEIWKNSGFTSKIYDAIEDFYVTYNPSSHYWKDQNENSRVNRAVRRALKDYVVLMAGYYHNRFQHSDSKNDYDKTELWYKRYLAHYSSYAQQDNIYFLYAELLSQKQHENEALKYYELAAYDNGIIVHKDAAYASILLTDRLHNQQLKAKSNDRQYLEKHIAYALKYAQKYPSDQQTQTLVQHAAELAYTSEEYKTTIELADIALANKSASDMSYLTVLKAEAYFKLGVYSESEKIYAELITSKDLDNSKRTQYQDRLALSIYRQGEASQQTGNLPLAIEHFSRIADVVATSSIAETGLYDAIALNMQHQQWQNAIDDIERFQKLFPQSKHQADVSKKLSVAYLSSNQGIKAAQAFEQLAAMKGDLAVQSAALWQAAELYEEKGRIDDAIRSYEDYAHKYKTPYPEYMEAMNKLTVLYTQKGLETDVVRWQQQIIKADTQALNNIRTDRTRYIVSTTYLQMARHEQQLFEQIRLTLPLKNSLRKKKESMQKSVKLYGNASRYKLFEVATEATHNIAMIYRQFSKSLLDSDRPVNLSADELDQYEILLEDQAFPFEDKAIEFHEINLSRVKDGFYNEWVRKSHQELITLFPVRYKRESRVDTYVNVMH